MQQLKARFLSCRAHWRGITSEKRITEINLSESHHWRCGEWFHEHCMVVYWRPNAFLSWTCPFRRSTQCTQRINIFPWILKLETPEHFGQMSPKNSESAQLGPRAFSSHKWDGLVDHILRVDNPLHFWCTSLSPVINHVTSHTSKQISQPENVSKLQTDRLR